VTRGAAFVAALLVAIGRPAWWLMALSTFLLRGGIGRRGPADRDAPERPRDLEPASHRC
jgi:hypothetical protein